ncbi:MAG: hypothetical protein QW429_03055 [Thermoprotei archaeon]
MGNNKRPPERSIQRDQKGIPEGFSGLSRGCGVEAEKFKHQVEYNF